MALYPYECPSCGHTDEILKKVSEADDPVVCGVCGADMERQIAESQTHRMHSHRFQMKALMTDQRGNVRKELPWNSTGGVKPGGA